LIFAAGLKTFNLPLALEAFLILGLTVLGCFIGFEYIKRNRLTRWLFGLQ